MKIAVVGCGALGSFYGAKLVAAGEDVHFLLRSDYEAVRRAGIQVKSFQGDFHAWPRCAVRPEEIGVSDLVVVGIKTTANEQFSKLLPPLVGEATIVLTLQNGLGNEEQLAALCGAEHVMGGLCFVCLNRVQPGVIQHLAHGRVVIGEFQRHPNERTHRVAEMLRRAGMSCDVTENLERAHWEKLAWNVPFNGLGVASAAGYQAVVSGQLPRDAELEPCLTTDVLLADSCWEQLVRELMQEVITTANTLRLELPPGLAEELIARTRVMGAYKPSSLIDFERRQAIELQSLFVRPLEFARKAGVPTPRLAALCEVLRQLDPAGRIVLPAD